MTTARVMAICLDAYDAELGDRLIAEGRLPGLARLKAQSARFALEHGSRGLARHTGLAWEHFSSGRTPETAGKWSAISFDPNTFRVWQSHATERPFFADLDARCVVFDAPYFNLEDMSAGRGVVGWGGHDIGSSRHAKPDGLIAEMQSRFGPAVDVQTFDRLVYPSVEHTREIGELICRSVRQRGEIAEWLFGERFTDWDVALLGFTEPHDALEILFHGMDSDHHAAHLPSAPVAREGLIAVYEAVSAEIERLMDRFPDASFAIFTMHGMGQNDFDLATTLLLPELMYRMSFGETLFHGRPRWREGPSPLLGPGESWNEAVIGAMRHPIRKEIPRRLRRGANRIYELGMRALALPRARPAPIPHAEKAFGVDWMPAYQYHRYWPQMDAFGMLGYADGRIRINLEGRERHGRVPREQYLETLRKIEETLLACVDTKTGQPVVSELTRTAPDDPMSIGETQADLCVLWNGSPVGFRHPVLGEIGPAPLWRTGGHSGGHGALYLRAADLVPGDYGVRSSFDVAPTIVDLLGLPRPDRMDGDSVVAAAKAQPAVARPFSRRTRQAESGATILPFQAARGLGQRQAKR